MPDRPILFSGPMVLALLDGRKTQTRRICRPQPFGVGFERQWMVEVRGTIEIWDPVHGTHPYAIGDRLWVREAWRAPECFDDTKPSDLPVGTPIRYEADGSADRAGWGRLRPGMFMPRWASRLTDVVTDVRVQRLQEITNEDCIAEGIPVAPSYANVSRAGPVIDAFAREHGLISHYGARYRDLWDSLNAKRAPWDSNPWVVALTFTIARQNIDALAAPARAMGGRAGVRAGAASGPDGPDGQRT